MDYNTLRDLAIIVIAAKCLGIAARYMKLPQVVGEIVAGLFIGPSVLGIVGQSLETYDILRREEMEE